jgi:hypothetical protein
MGDIRLEPAFASERPTFWKRPRELPFAFRISGGVAQAMGGVFSEEPINRSVL